MAVIAVFMAVMVVLMVAMDVLMAVMDVLMTAMDAFTTVTGVFMTVIRCHHGNARNIPAYFLYKWFSGFHIVQSRVPHSRDFCLFDAIEMVNWTKSAALLFYLLRSPR